MRTVTIAASSFANVGAFSTPGKWVRFVPGHQIPAGAVETELAPWRLSLDSSIWTWQYAESKWWKASRVLILSALHGINCLLLLDTRTISRANIWVRKKMEWGLCPLSSALWFVWSSLANTGFGSSGERAGVGFSMCCQTVKCFTSCSCGKWKLGTTKYLISVVMVWNPQVLITVVVTLGSLPSQCCIHCVLYQPEIKPSYLLLLCLYFLRQKQKWLWMQSSWMSIRTAMV